MFFGSLPPPPPACLIPDLTTLRGRLSFESLTETPPDQIILLVIIFAPHVFLALRIIFRGFISVSNAVSSWRRFGLKSLLKQYAGAIIRLLQSAIPAVSRLIDDAVKDELSGIEKDLLGDGDASALISLPPKGRSDVLQLCTALHDDDSFVKYAGKLWGGIYHDPSSKLTKLQADVWRLYNTSNALYPKEFGSLRKMEAELLSMTVGLIHGHEIGACGLLASGGTEAILLAVLAYREHGRVHRGITSPQIVCGLSAHPALTKACAYFGVELIKAPLDPHTMKLTSKAVRPLITSNTVAIYASAPCFTFGAVDEIEELGKLAKAYNIGLHVDNCLGGYLLSFMSMEGLYTRPWDFSVEGVTTISIDLHKYGFTSKGASVCAFRSPQLRRLTYVPSADGCEGLYVTPTIQGSRSGATIAAAWATLVHMGEDGYRKAACELTAAQEALKDAVRSIKGIQLCGDPTLAIVAINGVDGLNVYALATLLEKRGWGLFTGQKPPTLSVPVGERTPHLLKSLITDLRECVAYLLANPTTKPEGNAAVYGAAASIPDVILEEVMRGYVDIKLSVKPAGDK